MGQQGSSDKTERGQAEAELEPQWRRCAGRGRKCPRLVEQEVGQKKNSLNNQDETNNSSGPHVLLDSAARHSDEASDKLF